jgi:hypothetical protein
MEFAFRDGCHLCLSMGHAYGMIIASAAGGIEGGTLTNRRPFRAPHQHKKLDYGRSGAFTCWGDSNFP